MISCPARLQKSQTCAIKGGRCTHTRAYWCQGAIKTIFGLIAIAAIIYGLIWLACWRSDAYAWANKPIVYGPVDWQAKNVDCIRRAILISGYIEYVEDDRYCIVKKEGK